MEEITIESLYKNYRRKIQGVSLKFRRYCYDEINWDNHVIGIKGERGESAFPAKDERALP